MRGRTGKQLVCEFGKKWGIGNWELGRNWELLSSEYARRPVGLTRQLGQTGVPLKDGLLYIPYIPRSCGVFLSSHGDMLLHLIWNLAHPRGSG